MNLFVLSLVLWQQSAWGYHPQAQFLKQSTASPNSGIVAHSGTGDIPRPLPDPLLRACEDLSKIQAKMIATQERINKGLRELVETQEKIIEIQNKRIAAAERALNKPAWDLLLPLEAK